MKRNVIASCILLLALVSCGTHTHDTTKTTTATSSSWVTTTLEAPELLTGSAVIEIQNSHPLAGKTLNFNVKIVEITKWENNTETDSVENGDTIKVDYIGTHEDGEEFDSSTGKAPLEFVVWIGRMIKWFDEWVVWMKFEESKDLVLAPEDAYGPASFEQTIELSRLQEFANAGFEIEVGAKLPTQQGEITITELLD